jgi:hypothetical protein
MLLHLLIRLEVRKIFPGRGWFVYCGLLLGLASNFLNPIQFGYVNLSGQCFPNIVCLGEMPQIVFHKASVFIRSCLAPTAPHVRLSRTTTNPWTPASHQSNSVWLCGIHIANMALKSFKTAYSILFLFKIDLSDCIFFNDCTLYMLHTHGLIDLWIKWIKSWYIYK